MQKGKPRLQWGNDGAAGLTAGYLEGHVSWASTQGSISSCSVLSLRDPGSFYLGALPFMGASESCILSSVSSQQTNEEGEGNGGSCGQI